MKHLTEIERQVSRLLATRWTDLHEDQALARSDLRFPGVYMLAYTAAPRINGSIVMMKDIFYIGMSNSAGGVRQRLNQFKAGIVKNTFHSGAMRFYREYSGGKPFSRTKSRRKLYFSALTFECESNKGLAQPDDLRLMGQINCLEYYAIAHIAERTGKKPALNKFGPRPTRAE
jgi:hypothetical protein